MTTRWRDDHTERPSNDASRDDVFSAISAIDWRAAGSIMMMASQTSTFRRVFLTSPFRHVLTALRQMSTSLALHGLTLWRREDLSPTNGAQYYVVIVHTVNCKVACCTIVWANKEGRNMRCIRFYFGVQLRHPSSRIMECLTSPPPVFTISLHFSAFLFQQSFPDIVIWHRCTARYRGLRNGYISF